MSTTSSGIPRVKAARRHKAKPLETPVKHLDPRKKGKAKKEIDYDEDPITNWRKK